MEKGWFKSALKAEWITLLFIVLCTIGFLFKDSIPHNFFTASFMHASRSHYTGNIMLFLLLSPLVEEKYGKINYLCAWFFTAIVEYSFHYLCSTRSSNRHLSLDFCPYVYEHQSIKDYRNYPNRYLLYTRNIRNVRQ